MDCVIPAHNIRTFSCAVGCLSRIGKEMYIEFDPLQGLVIRTLNDAKSAFCSFSFAPQFFERCCAPLEDMAFRNSRHATATNSHRNDEDEEGDSQSQNERRGTKRPRDNEKEPSQDSIGSSSTSDKYICRVPLRIVHSILRPRKGLLSLRIKSHERPNHDNLSQLSNTFISPTQDSHTTADHHQNHQNLQHQLSFEFLLSTNGILRITRRIHISDATSLKAVAPRTNSSDIVSHPKTFLKLLSPLKKTAEVAFYIQHSKQMVSASSFHPGDTSTLSLTSPIMAESSMSANVNAHLKTETSMGCDEFEEYHFRDDRILSPSSPHLDDENDDNNDENEDDNHDQKHPSNNRDPNIPLNVNEEVTLVFGIKEVKAMLQFCSQTKQDDSEYDHHVVFYFEWGGKPIILETEGDHYTGELIMATLDHSLLVGFHSR